MIKNILFFSLLIVSITIKGQVPVSEWQNTIGGSNDDYLIVSKQTLDGGYILGGYSNSNFSGDKTENSNGGFDYWVIKLNSLGIIQWQNTIGGNDDDFLSDISQTTDGGFIIGGRSASNISGDKTENSNGSQDYWVLKLNSIGIIQWQNTIGGASNDQLYSISETNDGGFIIGGRSASNISGDKTENSIGTQDYWVLKLNSVGIIQWQNTIGGSQTDQLRTVKQTSDGGYILGGYSTSQISGDKTENSNGGHDYWIVKLNSTGNIQWQNTIGGSGSDYLFSIDETSDGDFILTGNSSSNISGDKTENTNGQNDIWVLKLNSTGIIEWQNTIGGSLDELSRSVIQLASGGYVLVGYTNSGISGDKSENSNGDFDYWFIKLDNTGVLEYEKSFGGSNLDRLISVSQTSEGGFILSGYSNSDISGDKTENSNGLLDFWVIKLSAETLSISKNELKNKIRIHPNPIENKFSIHNLSLNHSLFKIYDLNGRLVHSNNINEIAIDISNLTSGFYFLNILNKHNVTLNTFKIIKN